MCAKRPDDGELDSDNEGVTPAFARCGRNTGRRCGLESLICCPAIAVNKSRSPGAWFKQPKYIPNWLYIYLGVVVKPLIITKERHQLLCHPRWLTMVHCLLQAFGSTHLSQPFFFHGVASIRRSFIVSEFSSGCRIS